MRLLPFFSLLVCFSLTLTLYSQKAYHVSGGELIFSSGFFEGPLNEKIPSKVRFTLLPHLHSYWNYDFTNHLGFFSGISLRNIGMITEEDNITYGNSIYSDVKTKRRSLFLGVPLALKIGSFSDHFFIYIGGQYEWLFRYKENRFIDDRKIKSSEWFSDKVNPLIPSLFAGIQLPKGISLRTTWLLDNFLNPEKVPAVTRSDIFYISLSFNLKTKEIRKKIHEDEPANYAMNF